MCAGLQSTAICKPHTWNVIASFRSILYIQWPDSLFSSIQSRGLSEATVWLSECLVISLCPLPPHPSPPNPPCIFLPPHHPRVLQLFCIFPLWIWVLLTSLNIWWPERWYGPPFLSWTWNSLLLLQPLELVFGKGFSDQPSHAFSHHILWLTAFTLDPNSSVSLPECLGGELQSTPTNTGFGV